MQRWLPIVLLGCSDYGFKSPTDDVDRDADTDADTDSDTDADTDSDTDADTDSDVDTDLPATCSDFDFSWSWSASLAFVEQADPTDADGLSWMETAFDDTAYTAVSVPHLDIPVGTDRVYRAHFELQELPPSLALDIQSDDGIVIWLNGVSIGQYGGTWQQEGCVNDAASCVNTTDVPPVDVSPLLQLGANVLAARVSNPVQNAWFELIPVCEDVPLAP